MSCFQPKMFKYFFNQINNLVEQLMDQPCLKFKLSLIVELQMQFEYETQKLQINELIILLPYLMVLSSIQSFLFELSLKILDNVILNNLPFRLIIKCSVYQLLFQHSKFLHMSIYILSKLGLLMILYNNRELFTFFIGFIFWSNITFSLHILSIYP